MHSYFTILYFLQCSIQYSVLSSRGGGGGGGGGEASPPSLTVPFILMIKREVPIH